MYILFGRKDERVWSFGLRAEKLLVDDAEERRRVADLQKIEGDCFCRSATFVYDNTAVRTAILVTASTFQFPSSALRGWLVVVVVR